MADRRRLDRRRGDDRQQVGDLRERLGGHAHRLVDLAPHERASRSVARPRARALGQQPVDVVAVAGVGRHAAGRRVRVREQARAPRARRARCGSSRARRRRRGRRRAPSIPRAARSPRSRRRPCASSSSWRGVSTLRSLRAAPAVAQDGLAALDDLLAVLLRVAGDRRRPRAGSEVIVISSSGTPMPRNWTSRLRSASGSPAASVWARATCAIVHSPCRIRPGRPTERANSSSRWIGLKSPDAPA